MSSSAPPKSVAIEPGTRLDRYELLCLLAHGGMANVWLARVQGKLGFNKLLAIKTILQSEADNETFREMFLDEARIASRIDHPSVVHIADVGELQGIPYLVMDLIEGEPLHKLARACEKAGEKIPLGVALRVVADACQGLHAAHELADDAGHALGVVHRDISPQNILVTTSGISKVIDFGIAKARDRSARQTTAGTLKGKISYMPREQALGKDVDRRADTWALGAVLYFLIRGEPPYQGDTQLATLQLAMNGAPIEALPANVPMPVRTLVSRALSQQLDRRFQTAAEMGASIEKLMQTLGVVTPHSEVARFINRVMKEKLEARKQLIANAIEESAKRERAKEELSVAIEMEIGDTDFIHRPNPVGIATMAGVRTADGSQPDLLGSGSYGSYGSSPGTGTGPGTNPGTGGGTLPGAGDPSTFAAQNLDAFPPRRNNVAIATMVLAAMSIIAAAGIGAFLYATRSRPAEVAAKSPPVTTTAEAPPPTSANTPPTSASAPPTSASAAPATSETAKPAAPVAAGAATKPAGRPGGAPWKGVTTAKPAGATAPANAGKKRDDEAGF